MFRLQQTMQTGFVSRVSSILNTTNPQYCPTWTSALGHSQKAAWNSVTHLLTCCQGIRQQAQSHHCAQQNVWGNMVPIPVALETDAPHQLEHISASTRTQKFDYRKLEIQKSKTAKLWNNKQHQTFKYLFQNVLPQYFLDMCLSVMSFNAFFLHPTLLLYFLYSSQANICNLTNTFCINETPNIQLYFSFKITLSQDISATILTSVCYTKSG